jgi:transcriptional regulator with GAF, ATPase, and Fis domain
MYIGMRLKKTYPYFDLLIKFLTRPMKNLIKTPVLILIPIILATIYIIPGSLNDKILEAEISFYHWIKPAEKLSDEIVVVTIGDEDIRILEGWPISRDYYSYAIHALKQGGANAIGLDLFFSGPDKRYPRYDSTMADFISLAGNVVLPMFFSGLRDSVLDNELLFGQDPHYSLPVLSQAAAANGFSNFGPDPVLYSIPLVVNTDEDIQFSFAAELYRIFGDQDNEKAEQPETIEKLINSGGNIYLNYADFQDIPYKYGFVELLQTFRKDPDSIPVKGKLAVIINTITGVTQIKSIPLNDNIPASYIHVNAISNLLLQNWIIIIPPSVGWIIIFIFGILFLIKWPLVVQGLRFRVIILSCLLYGLVALLLGVFLQIVLPLVYPFIAILVGGVIAQMADSSLLESENQYRHTELDKQLSDKERQLELMRQQLKDLNKKLEKETALSEKNRQQLLEHKDAITDLEKELDDLRTFNQSVQEPYIAEIKGIIFSESGPMKKILDLVMKVSSDDIPVLINGETGTGKELIAQTIHEKSMRNNAPFIAINCGALPETLLESELFGHEKGAFTGATTLRKGRFELADGGTVFLDEVTETSPAFQSRLLRVLQESNFERVGGQKPVSTNVRIIAATNKDIQKLITQDKFRSDLFYRLNGFPITVPPLRERKDDIAILANHFIEKHRYENIKGLSDQAMQKLTTYHWPGNVRELENCIRRAAILAQSEGRSLIKENDLPQDVRDAKSELQLQLVHQPLEEQILELMRSFKFSRSSIVQTANLLGNRDRGTITEYFKGICFQYLVEAEYDLQKAILNLAGSTDQNVRDNLNQKIKDYLSNLENYAGIPPQSDKPANEQAPPYKGLPKKYDLFLDQILANLDKLREQL